MADKNKVKYGLKNVHYADVIETDGIVTFGTDIGLWPGAVNLNLPPSGDPTEFYADNRLYWEDIPNDGYEGTIETALTPDDFKIRYLGYKADANNVIVENVDGKRKPFALLFEFDGDETNTRHALYYCTASRPTLASSTVTKQRTPITETLTFKAKQRPDTGDIHAYSNEATIPTAYEGWYEAVYVPVPAATPGG